MPASRSGPPLLPAIAHTPLLSGDLGIPGDLFAALAGPLPTITIGAAPPTFDTAAGTLDASRSHRYLERRFDQPRSKPSSPLFAPAFAPPPPPPSNRRKDSVEALLELLESMQNDVTAEVRRVHRSIQEARMLVRACREDSRARESARRQKLGAEPAAGGR